MRGLLESTGMALYGPRWQADLARDMGMSVRHMRRLVSGEAALSDGMIVDLRRIAEERAADLDEVIKRLLAGNQ